MSIVSDSEILDFLGISNQMFTITASNDVINLRTGVPTVLVDIPDGTYDGTSLATALTTAINTAFANTPVFTATYSITTFKFTITPASGTVAYIHTNSDAGYTLGFNQSHTAAASITSDFACGDPSEVALQIRNSVEEWVQGVYCRRYFESATYKERYDGTGMNQLWLKNKPVTSLTRFSIGTVDALRICNTNGATTASVSANSTGLILEKDGIENSTITYALNSTLSAIATAINVLGNGWQAQTVSSVYDAYMSSILLERFGLNCIDSNWVYLNIPEAPEDDFDFDSENGIVYMYFQIPKGFKNIFVQYTAGFSSSNMPSDLKLAIQILVKHFMQRKTEESFGLKNYTLSEISQTFEETSVPQHAQQFLSRYRRMIV
jgi:hypothetical protein